MQVDVCSDDDIENDPSQKVDDADEEDDGEREAKWRMERLEREKFLEEHHVSTILCVFLHGKYCVYFSQVLFCFCILKQQPFYGSVEFVRENPGEPVPEETFTHYSHRRNINCVHYCMCMIVYMYLNFVLSLHIFFMTLKEFYMLNVLLSTSPPTNHLHWIVRIS